MSWSRLWFFSLRTSLSYKINCQPSHARYVNSSILITHLFLFEKLPPSKAQDTFVSLKLPRAQLSYIHVKFINTLPSNTDSCCLSGWQHGFVLEALTKKWDWKEKGYIHFIFILLFFCTKKIASMPQRHSRDRKGQLWKSPSTECSRWRQDKSVWWGDNAQPVPLKALYLVLCTALYYSRSGKGFIIYGLYNY